jgi:antitoxin ParD1/3/4
MPTRNISLTRDQDAFIAKVVATGEYQNASEAVRDALRALQQRRRAQIEAGVRALDEGDFDKVDGADLERYLARLAPRRRARKRAR